MTRITVSNPQNDPRPSAGVMQGPAPTTVKIYDGDELRIYTASYTRPQWMEMVARDGRCVRQGWIDSLPVDAAEAVQNAR